MMEVPHGCASILFPIVLLFLTTFYISGAAEIVQSELATVNLTVILHSTINDTVRLNVSTEQTKSSDIAYSKTENSSVPVVDKNLVIVKEKLSGLAKNSSVSTNNSSAGASTAKITTTVRPTMGTTSIPLIKDAQFDYIIENPGLCDSDTNVFVWVHTSPKNFRKRIALRNTWTNPYHFPLGYKAKVGFFIGAVYDKIEKEALLTQQKIEFENDVFHDIIQETYIDHYHNLTYKAISAVKWISQHCSQAKLVIKSDDDALVHTALMFKHIEELQSYGQMLNKTVMCRVNRVFPVERAGKWKVSRSEYNETDWPPYCPGLTAVMTGDLVPQLYEQSRKLKPVWVDDAWFFGIVMRETKAVFKSIVSNMDPKELFDNQYGMLYHLYMRDYYEVWKKIWAGVGVGVR